jgi:hypothetical protein
MDLKTFFGGGYETPLLYFVSKRGREEQSVMLRKTVPVYSEPYELRI